MKENLIKKKSFVFALEMVKLYKLLCIENSEIVLSKQLLRSGTSIGTLVREAEHAESKAGFIQKMAIVQKEANETEFWMELLYNSKYTDKENYVPVVSGIIEINRMLSSVLISSKKNMR